MRESRIPHRLSVALATAALLLAGCGAFQDPPEPTRLTAPPETATADEAPAATPEFDTVDSTFAQLMIAHHEQALTLVDLVPDRSTVPEVRALATEVAATQSREVEQLTRWLQEWDLPTEMDPAEYEDHPGMAGMLTEDELGDLAAASGAEFDRLWLEGMIRHHEGAMTMAQTQVDSGIHAPSRRLAEQILITQQAEISRMQAMLGD